MPLRAGPATLIKRCSTPHTVAKSASSKKPRDTTRLHVGMHYSLPDAWNANRKCTLLAANMHDNGS
eukprot:5615367-Pleurochrysis_carterae.AAC.1